jgi:hypothetical protein
MHFARGGQPSSNVQVVPAWLPRDKGKPGLPILGSLSRTKSIPNNKKSMCCQVSEPRVSLRSKMGGCRIWIQNTTPVGFFAVLQTENAFFAKFYGFALGSDISHLRCYCRLN